MKVRLALLALALGLAALAGPEAWARLIWRAGAPALALPLLDDPATRGAALYQMGHYEQANDAFTAVGRSATFNRALALAMTGDYALSVAYFDAYLFANQYDADAQRSRAAVDALIEPVIGEAMGHGRIRTVLAESGVATVEFDPEDPDQALLESEHDPYRINVKRGIDGERTQAAGDDWLDTLADAPGAYLHSRLAAEMARRAAAGIAAPQEDVSW